MTAKQFEPNGEAWVAHRMRYAGIATRFGHDPLEERVRLQPVRITAKLVSTHYLRFSRATGNLETRIAGKPMRVIAYRLAGQKWELV